LTAAGLPHFAVFIDNGDGTGLYRFSPQVGDRGDYAITLTAMDDGDGQGPSFASSTSQSFILTATSPAEPPLLAASATR